MVANRSSSDCNLDRMNRKELRVAAVAKVLGEHWQAEKAQFNLA